MTPLQKAALDYTAAHYARAARNIEHADDPYLHCAGVMANLLIYIRNNPLSSEEAQYMINVFCDKAAIKQVDGLMGDLVWERNEEGV